MSGLHNCWGIFSGVADWSGDNFGGKGRLYSTKSWTGGLSFIVLQFYYMSLLFPFKEFQGYPYTDYGYENHNQDRNQNILRPEP